MPVGVTYYFRYKCYNHIYIIPDENRLKSGGGEIISPFPFPQILPHYPFHHKPCLERPLNHWLSNIRLSHVAQHMYIMLSGSGHGMPVVRVPQRASTDTCNAGMPLHECDVSTKPRCIARLQVVAAGLAGLNSPLELLGVSVRHAGLTLGSLMRHVGSIKIHLKFVVKHLPGDPLWGTLTSNTCCRHC